MKEEPFNEIKGVQALIPGTWKSRGKGQATREAKEARAFGKEGRVWVEHRSSNEIHAAVDLAEHRG